MTVIDLASAIKSQDIVQETSNTALEMLGPVESYRLGKQSESEGDIIRAIEYFERAALLGHSIAQRKLAEYYEEGKVVPRDYIPSDYKRAYLYYKLSFEQTLPIIHQSTQTQAEYTEIMKRLRPHVSKEDWEWVRKEVLRHNKAANDWQLGQLNKIYKQ